MILHRFTKNNLTQMESMPCKIANFYLDFVHIIKSPPWQVEGQTKVEKTFSMVRTAWIAMVQDC